MTMNSHKFSFLYATTIIITLSYLLCLVVCFTHKPPQDTTRGLSFEEKARLGSTPPSCHNKCNQCHPCMAVQIPTLPSRNRVQPGRDRVMHKAEYFDSSSTLAASYKYSNYKPLGWKCTCGDHIFNP